MPGEINFSGFNGFDFGAIIDLTIQAESIPLENLQTKEQELKKKDSAFGDFGAEVKKVQDAIDDLVAAGTFEGLKATSSNDDAIGVTLGDNAVAGSYVINVTELARQQVTASTNGFATANDVAADGGTISFTIDGETTADIAISGSTTLTQLKDLVNAQGSGVVASVVHDGTSNKLVIQSRETGVSNGFTINNNLSNDSGTVVQFAAGQNEASGNAQNAQDANFTVNGLAITSASNAVTGAVPGTTIDLNSLGTATVKVAADHGALEEQLKTFITQYNKLREFFDKQSRLDVITGKPGPLAGDTILRQALADIRNTILTANGNDGQYRYLTEIGLEFEQDGSLKLNQERFNTAMSTNVADVKKLFQGDGTVAGVFQDLSGRLDSLDSTAGLIKTTRENLDKSIRNMRDRIIAQQLRLDNRRIELQKMFAAADQAMSQLTSQQGALGSLGGFF